MIDPDGTVALGAVVTVPGTSPTTFGTRTWGRPEDTTSKSALPFATGAGAPGVCLIMIPAGTVALDANVVAPTVRPASVIALEAAVWVRPTTSGTVALPAA